jgi:putative heme-binding domain-containing protein
MTGKTLLTRTVVVWLAIVGCGSITAAQVRPHVVPEGPLSPQEQLAKFHLPPGFEIELVASEPEIRSPLSINFDRRGRLWVTDTIEYPFPPKGPGRDALKVFEDRDGDGRYETATTLVDKLSMPTGAEPIPGGAIVFSVPSIFACYDADGDDRIDRRQVLYTEFGDVDAHGMNNGFTRWLDGWIYACHGYANTSHVQGSDGQSITMNSGNGYRFRMDGSHIEYVWHGQVNPYGIAFDSLGNLFTADCHSKPAYCLLRGAYYPSFGKPHDGLGFGPQLIEHSHGSTSISGIAYYAAEQFPESYRDCVFMGNSVTGRVNCDKVTAVGSSLVGTELPDFVTCDDRWFRPVEIKLGPDGALYIADFYDCIIGYYEVPLTHPRRDRTRGRIWRVVYRGTEGEAHTRRKVYDLTHCELDALWNRLADPNLSVRMLATHEIVDRFPDQAIERLRDWMLQPCDPHQRAHGLWVLERLGGLDDALVLRLADDEDRLVRVHLVKALAERADWGGSALPTAEHIRGKLSDSDPFVRRAAADALGRHPESANVEPLLRLWVETPPEDTYLIHTVRMALRDQLSQPDVFHEQVRLGDDLDRARRLMDVLLGVRTAPAAEFVLAALRNNKHDPTRIADLVHFATRYVDEAHLDEVADFVLSWQSAPAGQQLAVFRSFGLATAERGGSIPEAFYPWAERLASELLEAEDPARKTEAMQLVGALKLSRLYEPVARIGASREEKIELRIAAIQACVATGDARRLELLDGLLGSPDETPELRRGAAYALSLVNTDQSRELLLARLVVAHQRLAAGIAAALAGSSEGAEMLLSTIAEGKASPLLLRELGVLRRLEGTKLPDLEKRLAELTANLPPQDEMTGQLIAQRRDAYLAAKPDLERGEAVFEKQCGICHQLAGEGRKYGPDLDGIGVRGLDRLLEDLLDPSRNVDPAFRSTIVLTDRGLTQTGLALRDEGQVLILVDSEGKELRLKHDEIEERIASPLSPMPNAVEKSLEAGDFNDLMRFLLNATTPLETAGDTEQAAGE